ncbi:MAG: nucleotidyltransferase family protein [Prevotella sp.]
MKQAMIFAAGLGTRLKPLTDTMPKALVRVGDQPLIAHVILRLREAGFSRIVVNVHHFADQIEAYLDAQDHFGLDIHISDERAALLDTGGGIRHAMPLFDASSPILIHNVDILSNIDLARFYQSGQGADAMLLVSPRQTQRYLLFDDEERLCGWTHLGTGEVRSPYSALDPAACQHYAFSGIHLFSPSLFPLLADMPERFGIIDFYLRHCADRPIRGYVQPGLRLMDVGKADTLAEANDFLKTIQ